MLEVVEFVDNTFPVGQYETGKQFVVHGKRIRAKNPVHALFLWCNKVSKNEGMNKRGYILSDGTKMFFSENVPEGTLYMPKTVEMVLENVSIIPTIAGKRYVYTAEMPKKFWDIPKDERPGWLTFIKTGKMFKLYIWGQSKEEVLVRFLKFQEMTK